MRILYNFLSLLVLMLLFNIFHYSWRIFIIFFIKFLQIIVRFRTTFFGRFFTFTYTFRITQLPLFLFSIFLGRHTSIIPAYPNPNSRFAFFSMQLII